MERDLKSPTLHKLTVLCEVMEVHPLTLLTLAYVGDDTHQADELLAQVRREFEAVLKKHDTPWCVRISASGAHMPTDTKA
nr:XRE family transcriptional regulator [Burkholderia gladioli]